MEKKKTAENESVDATLISLQEACIKAGDGKKIILAYAQGYAAAVGNKTEKKEETDTKEKEEESD